VKISKQNALELVRDEGCIGVTLLRRDKRISHLLAGGLALVLYLILALIYFGTRGDWSRMYLGDGSDPQIFIWCINWWPWAVAHGLNPFITHHVWYPHGYNLTWVTSVPSAALMALPVTFLGNAVMSFNVLTLLAPALFAWTGFLLARYVTRDTPASLIAGYLIGFSSYELGEVVPGHLHLNLVFAIPLLVLLVLQRIRADLSRQRFVIGVTVLLLLQLGLSTEILATACVLGAITWAIFLAFAPLEERRRLWMVAGEIILAAGIMTVLAAPFLFFVFKDLGAVPQQINSAEYYSVDPLNFVIPSLGGTQFASVVKRFDLAGHGGYDAYLGLPLILILILQLRDFPQRPYLKPLYVSLLLFVVLSLGPSLRVAGMATNIWLPWRLGLHLPLIHQALSNRFSMYIELITALAVAFWLSGAKPGWDRAGRFTLAGLACLFLLPNRALFRWTPFPSDPFFEPHNVEASLGQNANVLVLPYGPSGPGMIWQCQAGMRFTQSGGNLGLTQSLEENWPILDALNRGTAGCSFENDISAFCLTHRVSAILVGPGTPAPVAAAVEALHWPKINDHGVRVVRVPDLRLLHFHYVSGDYWPEGGAESWIGHQIQIVAHNQAMQLRITGRYGPPGFGPVEVSVANGSDVSRYLISQLGTQVINLPANGSITVTASRTWVPDGGARHLSVAISLQEL
jgi:hypothetical protein